jgi:hypothetical protein
MNKQIFSLLAVFSLVISLSASGQVQHKVSSTNHNEVSTEDLTKAGNLSPGSNAGILLMPLDSSSSSLRTGALYLTTGVSVIVHATGNLEVVVAQKPTGFFKAYSIRLGFGFQGNLGGEGNVFLGGVNMLTGSKNSHFEVGLGWMALIDEASLPLLSAGYRFQKPGGRFVFRTGVGFIEGLYCSLGTAF